MCPKHRCSLCKLLLYGDDSSLRQSLPGKQDHFSTLAKTSAMAVPPPRENGDVIHLLPFFLHPYLADPCLWFTAYPSLPLYGLPFANFQRSLARIDFYIRNHVQLTANRALCFQISFNQMAPCGGNALMVEF